MLREDEEEKRLETAKIKEACDDNILLGLQGKFPCAWKAKKTLRSIFCYDCIDHDNNMFVIFCLLFISCQKCVSFSLELYGENI